MINLPEVFMFKAGLRPYVAILGEFGTYHMEYLEDYDPSATYSYGGWTEREIQTNFDAGAWKYLGPVELPDEDVDIEMKKLEEIL